MATTYPNNPVYSSSILCQPADHVSTEDSSNYTTMTSQRTSREGTLPNPPFSFPAQTDSAPSTVMAPRTTRRRPMSAIETPTQSYHLAISQPDEISGGRLPLPAFSFNPGASLPQDPASPFSSFSLPQSPRTLPSGARPAGHGHRRGGSEFVGGQIRKGNSIAVISGSPTKLENGLETVNFAPPRRGHRRGMSSAMSTDLALLSPPPDLLPPKGNSAPATPTLLHHPRADPVPVVELGDSVAVKPEEPKQPEAPDAEQPNEVSVKQPQTKPSTRARVGFSDTVEFIPRPLSLVSTDTSSTITARHGHRMSSSISSMISIAVSEGSENPTSPDVPLPRDNVTESRPSTAGAILEHHLQAPDEFGLSSRRRNSIPALLSVPEATSTTLSTPSPSKASKRWSFFGFDTFSNNGSPTKSRTHSSSSADSAPRAVVHDRLSSDRGSDIMSDSEQTPVTKTKKEKRKKGMKGWAGSILPRKTKNYGDKRAKYDVRPPTPPASIVPPEDYNNDHIDFDNLSPQMPPTLTIETSTPPRSSGGSKLRDEISSPIIDLDAALGPFNTPLPHNPEWEAAQRAAGNAGKRRLHSSQGMRGFSGPGMHYHRRSESAPDLPPFEPGRNIHRFGSNSTMADVFEEDEEDGQQEAGQSQDSTSCSDTSNGDATPPAITPQEPPIELAPNMRRNSSGTSEKDQAAFDSTRAQQSKAALPENLVTEETAPLRFRSNNIFQRPSTGSPRLSPRSFSGATELPAFDLGTPHLMNANGPLSPHSMSYASGYPSPRSPMSADTQLLSTAPSSVNEENSFQSLLLGEPGPEVRLSVDIDIPSLTSSNSTMTRESTYYPHARMSQPTLRQPRPLSVSSAAFGRRRSSLVSLSRLISSSHGERSKLSIEVTLDNEAKEKKPKSGKSRLGKLMQFLKPSKDGSASSA